MIALTSTRVSRLTIPATTEQRPRLSRRRIRYDCELQCTVHDGQIALSGVVLDASSEGLRLGFIAPCALSGPITVEVTGGARLDGEIIWRRGHNAGVRLSTGSDERQVMLFPHRARLGPKGGRR